MTNTDLLSIRFFPAGLNRVRFELRINARYTLIGEYVDGVLRGIQFIETRS